MVNDLHAPPVAVHHDRAITIQNPSYPARSGEALVNKGKFAVHPPEEVAEWVKQQRIKMYEMRRVIGSFYDRVRPCGAWPIKKDGDISVVLGKNKSVYYTQLRTCKSVWACPSCSLKINQKNANEIRNMLTNAVVVDGYKAVVVALSLPHYSNERLSRVLDDVVETFRGITGSVKYKGQHRKGGSDGLKHQFGVQGFIKVLEVKRSLINGWHPHLHVVFVLDPKTLTHIQTFAEEIVELWAKAIYRRTKKKVKKGVQVFEEIYNIEGISNYLTKWDVAKELAFSHAKDDGKSIPVFGLIEKLIETGEAQYQEDFLMFAKAFKGKSPVSPSKGFKKRFLRGIEEKTDEQACSDGDIDKLLFSMAYALFKQIRSKKKEAQLLNLAQYNPEEVRGFLREHVPDGVNVAPSGDPPKFVVV